MDTAASMAAPPLALRPKVASFSVCKTYFKPVWISSMRGNMGACMCPRRALDMASLALG